MAFSEDLKLKVKKLANFQCCRCHEISVEVHHILPQKNNGPDPFDNAAPLCPSCHSLFGDNPEKRKEIGQMRDHWYEVVGKMYPDNSKFQKEEIEKIAYSLEALKMKQEKSQTSIDEVKQLLKQTVSKSIDQLTVGTIGLGASNLISASGATLSGINVNSVSTMAWCPVCSKFSTLYGNRCPYCGVDLN